MHWGCAHALAETLETSRWMCGNPFVKDLQLRQYAAPSRCLSTKEVLANLDKFCDLWVRAVTFSVFCRLPEDLDASPAFRQDLPSQPKAQDEEEEVLDQICSPEYSDGPVKMMTAPAAKLLRWEKTRDEIFGSGVEDWGDSWAVHLIFDDKACDKQAYLWNLLSQGRHLQYGARGGGGWGVGRR